MASEGIPSRTGNENNVDNRCGNKRPTEIYNGLEEEGPTRFCSKVAGSTIQNPSTTLETSDTLVQSSRQNHPKSRKRAQSEYKPTSSSRTGLTNIVAKDPAFPSPSVHQSSRKRSSSAKHNKELQQPSFRHSSYHGSNLTSDHCSTTDPFPFHRPVKSTSFHAHDISLTAHPCPGGAPLVADRFSALLYTDSSTAGATDIFSNVEVYSEEGQGATRSPVSPQTVIDWTSPATRRREYEEIDKSCRGIRGLWRKISPRWCQRNRRLEFYDEQNDSDGGSVRRYRIDIPPEVMEERAGLKTRIRVHEKELHTFRLGLR